MAGFILVEAHSGKLCRRCHVLFLSFGRMWTLFGIISIEVLSVGAEVKEVDTGKKVLYLI
ncbi:hypothetical protein OROMI_008449 [Orobanche minor]